MSTRAGFGAMWGLFFPVLFSGEKCDGATSWGGRRQGKLGGVRSPGRTAGGRLCCAVLCCAGQEGEQASVTRAVGVEGGFLSCCGECEWAGRPMRSCDVGPVGSSSVLTQALSRCGRGVPSDLRYLGSCRARASTVYICTRGWCGSDLSGVETLLALLPSPSHTEDLITVTCF